MKRVLITLLLFLPLGAFAEQRQRDIEYEALNLVIKKYGFVSIAAGKYQEFTWSAMEWFSVNVCSDSAEIIERK